MHGRIFGSIIARITAVGFVAGAFVTGGLAAAGAFTGAQHPAQPAAVTGSGDLRASSVGASVTLTFGTTTTATVPDPDEHKPTSTVHDPDRVTSTVTSTVKDDDWGRPTATATAEPEEPTSTVDDDDAGASNHGNCVEYAAHIAPTLGLAGWQRGMFVMLVAKDKTAVTQEVSQGGTPDAACVASIAKAKAAALAMTSPVTGTVNDHGGDDHDGNQHGGQSGATQNGTVNAGFTSGEGDHGRH